MSFIIQVEKHFGTTNIFDVLKITKKDSANAKALRKAYMAMALTNHPDKVSEEQKEEYTVRFQIVKTIFEFLQDSDLRKAYIETGKWPDDEKFNENVFTKRITVEDILYFKKEYIGSQEEKNDIKRLYEEGKGDICHVIDHLFFAEILQEEEDGRIQSIIEEMIENEELTEIKTKNNDRKMARRKKKALKEAKEAEESIKELGMDVDGDIGDMAGLQKAIMLRQQSRSDDMLAKLEAKYCTKPNSRKRKR